MANKGSQNNLELAENVTLRELQFCRASAAVAWLIWITTDTGIGILPRGTILASISVLFASVLRLPPL
jgi:hypothetical protein